MEKEKKKAILAIIALLIALSSVSAGSYDAQGGNITRVDISRETQTDIWQGLTSRITFVGPDSPTVVNATGGNVNYTQFFVTSPVPAPFTVTGFILFSNSTQAPVGLTPGNITLLDEFINNALSDSANRTFTRTTSFTINGVTINNVPTTNTYVNNGSQTLVFREGYLNDANGNIILAVEVDLNTQGYNTSFFDFQALLATKNRTVTPWYIHLALDFVGPRPVRRAGGGGRAIYCLPDWICTNWTQCENGYQTRQCRITGACRGIGAVPSTMRRCGAPQEQPTLKEPEVIEKIKEKTAEISVPKMIFTYAGEILEAIIPARNTDDESIENAKMTIDLPTLYQIFLPLHKEPRYYSIFKTIPLEELSKEMRWTEKKTDTQNIPPGQTRTFTVTRDTPMIRPQAINAMIELYSGPVPIAQREVTVLTETRPFKARIERDGYDTEVQMMIDNRGEKAKSANIELSLNRGRSTLFEEAYTLDIPADEVAIYGYKYYTPYKYDNAVIRYGKHKEVI